MQWLLAELAQADLPCSWHAATQGTVAHPAIQWEGHLLPSTHSTVNGGNVVHVVAYGPLDGQGFGLMLRALEQGTAGLKVPTGEVVDFPTNTSDALMSGGADAMAGAIERMHRKLLQRTGALPVLVMTGGAAVKLAPITDLTFETVDGLIFEGLLQLQSHRLAL